ncbi:MAG: tetratricopeptide repeat protein [Ignavibacteriales bacterium]|nr:tetratricopeptide repeat protein [Ignavibacteriales bacterium]
MLKPKKKISKKEMKEDKLVTTYFEATSWYENNKKIVNGVFTGLIIVAVLIVVVTNNMRSNNEKATTELGKVLRYYDEGKYDIAISGDLQENIRGLQSIVDDYGSTKSGELAKLYLANAYYAKNNYDKALQYYSDSSIKDDMLSASASAGVAACYEAKGEYEKAAVYYEKAAFKNGKDVLAAENLHHAAYNYSAAGKKEKAVELYKKLKKDYPTSTYAREIDRLIAEASS